MCRTLISLTCACLLTVCADVWAQQSASSGIVGQVTDSTGAALPGTTVTATDVGTGAQRVVVTDAEGRFSMPGLRAATYTLLVELPGFQSAEIESLVLRSGQTVRPAVTLNAAGFTEDVKVTADAPLLQTQTASVGQVVNEKMLEELPVTGRTLLNITTVAAGVTGRDFQRGTQYGRRDQFVTVEGGRDSSTNYVIDGVYVRSLRFNNMSLNPPIDAVQEVNLLRNSFSTEYGQGQAVVSVVTKSGSNQVTGSAYEYLRDESLNSRNFFAPQDEAKPALDRNQFGLTLGAPIITNRAFVFGAYEGLRQTEGEVNFANVPDLAWLQGDFSAVEAPILDPLTGRPFPGNRIPDDRVSPFAALQRSAVPAPNNDGPNNYRSIRDFTDTTDTATIRFDEVLSQSHNLFQRYIWYDSDQVLPGAITDTGRPQLGKNLSLGHTWVLSENLVHELRVGYNYARHIGDNRLPGESATNRNWVAEIGLRNIQGGIDPLHFGRPGANIAGFDDVPGTGLAQGATERVYSLSSATSKVAGAHNLRFGFQAQYRKFFQTTPVGARGDFTFNGAATGEANSDPHAVADFLLGYCSLCRGQFGTADSNYVSPTFAPFFDDVWQVNNKLTLQMGLRWEYTAPWHEVDDIEGSLDPNSGLIGYHHVPSSVPAALVPLIINEDGFFPAGIVEKDLNNWGPRVGVIYALDDRTVIRTGFGIFYDNLNLNELQFTRLVAPFAGRFDVSPTVGELQNVQELFPDLDSVTRFPAPFSMDPTNSSPWVRQWNVNVQRTFGQDYVFEVAYTGSQARNEHKRLNLNQPREGTAPLDERLPYPQWDPAILTSGGDGWGNFHGLSFRLEKRYSSGLFFTGSYQISSNRDNNSGEVEANDTAFAWDPDADEGYSRYHRRHRSSISFGYELPFGEGRRWLSSGAAARLLGDWNVSGQIRLQSGVPFSVSVSALENLGSYVPSRADFAPGREEDKGTLDNPTYEQWFDPTAYVVPRAGFQGRAGRNTLIGPAFRRVDLAITKRFPIARYSLDFRAEIFNLLNTTNFGNPGANISNSDAGVISSADDPRVVQLAFRLTW